MSLPYLEYEACVSVRIRKKDLPVFSKENCTVRLWDTSLDLYVRLMKCKHRHRHHFQHEKLMSLRVKRLFTDIKIYRCGSLMFICFQREPTSQFVSVQSADHLDVGAVEQRIFPAEWAWPLVASSRLYPVWRLKGSVFYWGRNSKKYRGLQQNKYNIVYSSLFFQGSDYQLQAIPARDKIPK